LISPFHPLHGLEILIQSNWEGDRWHLTMPNNNADIKQESQDLIYDVFKSESIEKEISDNDIRMTIAQRIVNRYGGKIWLEAQEGKSLCIHFIIALANREQRHG